MKVELFLFDDMSVFNRKSENPPYERVEKKKMNV